MKLASANDLIPFFYSGGNEHRADMYMLGEIFFLIDEGYLRISKKSICSHAVYYATIDSFRSGKIAVADFDGGGVAHMALKFIARQYILESFTQTDIEVEFHGFRPDLVSKEKNTLVECGTVNPEKISAYFEYPTVLKLICVPYPSDDEDLFASIFERTEDTREFLLYLKCQKLQYAKKQFYKRSTT